ncbi:hypothetical protein NHB34_03565 [Polynucleobacter sp. MWH-UH19D]|uniref:hypothetical protein n=1 Tax=Polynucleobacter sp. MWH-UH19D TaxID=1855610 RepID=UPI0033652D76
MRRLFALISLVLAIAPLGAIAKTNIYQCEVVSDLYIKQDGSLDLMQSSPRIGQRFTVIKKTGEIIGDVMDSLNKPRVIVSGVDKNSYKLLWQQKSSASNGVYIDYLSIDGSISGSKKPFGFFSGSLLMSGWCE